MWSLIVGPAKITDSLRTVTEWIDEGRRYGSCYGDAPQLRTVAQSGRSGSDGSALICY
jgi:hypothetical protein